MSVTRRNFLYAVGAAAGAYGLQGRQDVFWERPPEPDVGWSPGIETWTNSTCLVCPGRCGIRGRAVDGKLVRIIGNDLHPMSNGGICPRGAAGVQMLYHPKRIAGPVVRMGARGAGQWQKISADEAVSRLAARLGGMRDAGTPQRLALVSGYCAGSMDDLLRQFMRAYGSPNHIRDDYPDGTDAVMRLMHGISRRPGYDLDRADMVVSFGAPLFESWDSPVQAFAGFAGHGALAGAGRPHLIQIDTRFSRTAARAHEWVGIRPGTYGALALGIAYVLIRDGLVDASFLSDHVAGFEDESGSTGKPVMGFRSLVLRNYRTEEVSRLTGVPVSRITALAKALHDSEAPVVVCGREAMLDRNGLVNGVAVHSLNVLLGRVNRPGGVLFGDDSPIAPLAPAVIDATARRGLKSDPVGSPDAPYGEGRNPDEFARAVAESDSIEALLLYYANPLASSAHPEEWRSALSRIPFVVSFSPFIDETSSQADMIVPDLLPYERWQDGPGPTTYPFPVWGLTRPMVEPFGGGRHSGEVMLAVAETLGGGVARSLPYEDFEDLLRTRARGLFKAHRGMIMRGDFERRQVLQMEERGWWLPDYDDFDNFWDDLVERGGWTDLFHDFTDRDRLAATPDRRITLLPRTVARLLEDAGEGGGGGGEGGDGPYSPPTDDAASPADYPLRLLPFRISTLASGTMHLERWLVEQPGIFPDVQWTPWIGVHPATADRLGLEDGTDVWVVAHRGRYRSTVKKFLGTAPGNVCAPYGLSHPNGDDANPLRLLDGAVDDLTGLPDWNRTFVRLERI